jgi:CelD/BcsL family acetyltransferase involved in cellulose biosynthesis
VKARIITSLREFEALAPIWREVTTESRQTSPFLSHDWFACCWRTAGPTREREVWLLEDSAGPLAFVPLMRWRQRLRGLPVRMVGLLDSPDTPFIDLPAAGAREEIVAGFLRVFRERGDWDVLSLQKVPADSSTIKALEAVALSGNLPWRVAGTENTPYLTLSKDWEGFFRQQTQRFRKTCRNVENRLKRSGTVSVEEHRDVDPDGPLFAEVLSVSRQSWKGPRGLALATMEGMPRFFHELTRRASTNGWLRLWVLRLDGRAVATEYQIGANGSIDALRADFDAALADLSPGSHLLTEIIRALFEQASVHEYNMGPGSNEYKLRWATGSHQLISFEIYSPRRYGRLLHTTETRIVPRARQWRDRVSQLCS